MFQFEAHIKGQIDDSILMQKDLDKHILKLVSEYCPNSNLVFATSFTGNMDNNYNGIFREQTAQFESKLNADALAAKSLLIKEMNIPVDNSVLEEHDPRLEGCISKLQSMVNNEYPIEVEEYYYI